MPVTFEESTHTYTSHKGSPYISVTTLIKGYVPPFDRHYWSTYKAMQAVLTAKGEWSNYKRRCGGWENVVTYVREIDTGFVYRKEVQDKKREIMAGWASNAIEAAKTGTDFHKAMELASRRSGTAEMNAVEFPHVAGGKFDPSTMVDGLYPELLLWDDELEIAGQADQVFKVGNEISIRDFKTSKNVDKKAFMESTLLPPLTALPNANFYIYSLQLSLYALIMERRGFRIGTLQIEHIDKKTGSTIERLQAEYLKTETELMLRDWCESKRSKRSTTHLALFP